MMILKALKLARETLAHEKFLDEAKARVKELEAEVAQLRAEKQKTAVSSRDKSTGSWFKWRQNI